MAWHGMAQHWRAESRYTAYITSQPASQLSSTMTKTQSEKKKGLNPLTRRRDGVWSNGRGVQLTGWVFVELVQRGCVWMSTCLPSYLPWSQFDACATSPKDCLRVEYEHALDLVYGATSEFEWWSCRIRCSALGFSFLVVVCHCHASLRTLISLSLYLSALHPRFVVWYQS